MFRSSTRHRSTPCSCAASARSATLELYAAVLILSSPRRFPVPQPEISSSESTPLLTFAETDEVGTRSAEFPGRPIGDGLPAVPLLEDSRASSDVLTAQSDQTGINERSLPAGPERSWFVGVLGAGAAFPRRASFLRAMMRRLCSHQRRKLRQCFLTPGRR